MLTFKEQWPSQELWHGGSMDSVLPCRQFHGKEAVSALTPLCKALANAFLPPPVAAEYSPCPLGAFLSYRNAAWAFMAHSHWHNSCDASQCLCPAGQDQEEKGWVPVTPVSTVPTSTSFSEQEWGLPVMLGGSQCLICAALPSINWPKGSTPYTQEAQRAISAPGGHWA